MSMAAVTKILLTSAQQLQSKEKRNQLLIIVLLPIGFIVFFISIFIYKSTDFESDIYLISAEEVREEYETINKLDGNLVKSIYFIYKDKETEEKWEIKAFIEEFFLRKVSESVIVDGEEIAVEYYAFKSYLEIQAMLLFPPFSFDIGEMTLVNLYLLNPSNDAPGDGSDTGGGNGNGGGSGDSGDSDGGHGDGSDPDILPFRLLSPCAGYVSSYYGVRKHPVTGEELTFHTGIDLVGAHHQKIVSVADGVVVSTNTKTDGYGNYIKIKHTVEGITFYSFYAHLSSVGVSAGDTVNEGQTIGLEGGAKTDVNPGVSTGHHLHFEIRLGLTNSSCIDPGPYIGK